MSKNKPAFDYSKWDNIELSDDEDDCHPNIDKESWFRMKHRSRVEREDNEAKDKAKIKAEVSFVVQLYYRIVVCGRLCVAAVFCFVLRCSVFLMLCNHSPFS
jgi:Cdc37 N terminal kinase binding